MPAHSRPRTLDAMERVVADSPERLLRRVALGDDDMVTSLLAVNGGDLLPMLDARTRALVGLGALMSLGAPTTSYRCAVEAAYAAGATDEEILGVLSTIAPTIGLARTVAAAPGLALALGYDVTDDLT